MQKRPLDESQEQAVLYRKLLYLLHRSLVDLRSLSLAQEHQQAADLADAFEIMPGLLADWEDSHCELLRQVLLSYQAKYGERAYDYLSVLELDDDRFLEVYGTW